ncbi:MAG: hypothetical protein HFJ65_02675 [Eggerthellaceae bacterium]|nr:hypothetical protein [Eggerthellaceae bacterium]
MGIDDDAIQNTEILASFYTSPQFIQVVSTKAHPIDNFTFSLMAEDGLLIRLLTDYISTCNEGNIVAWLAIPFLSIIEHESNVILAKRYNLKLEKLSSKINEVRNHSKIYDKGGFSSHFINRWQPFLNHIVRIERNALHLPTEYVLTKRAPVSNTLLLAWQFGLDDFLDEMLAHSNRMAFMLGQACMEASVPNYALSIMKHGEKRFQTQSLDLHIEHIDFYSQNKIGLDSAASSDEVGIALFLDMFLSMLNALCYAYNHRWVGDLLFMKYALFYLSAYLDATKSLNNYLHDSQAKNLDTLRRCTLNKASRRQLESMKPVRNALVHYDFSAWHGLNLDTPRDSFSKEVARLTGKTLDEQIVFLKHLINQTAATIEANQAVRHTFESLSIIESSQQSSISDFDLALLIR